VCSSSPRSAVKTLRVWSPGGYFPDWGEPPPFPRFGKSGDLRLVVTLIYFVLKTFSSKNEISSHIAAIA
jgi:hypothetical protein